MRTAALVTKGGAIDWLCLPAFDSDACFAALLGTSNNGHWTIAPAVPVVEVQRRYRKNTLILETDFITEQGTVRLVDFMLPQPGRERSLRCRSIQCVKGAVPVRSDLSPIHWLSRNGGQHYSSRFRIVCEVERNFE
jgi:GH15 family glucan-1,4-alpha-glucosidase